MLPAELAAIELLGDDRLEWLQGQATNDVGSLKPGERVAFCFCEPTGQILAVIDAWAFDDRIVLVTERERASAVLERVERMTILEDVVAREAENIPANVREFLARFPKDHPEASEASRIAAGVPRWGFDMGPRTLPPELGPTFEADHVSYRKGCYTGQEVLMRMHSRGHTNRTWVGLVADRPMTVGAEATLEGQEVGRVTSASSATLHSENPASPDAEGATLYVAAATLRNEATSAGTTVLVGDVEATVRTMPIRAFPEAEAV